MTSPLTVGIIIVTRLREKNDGRQKNDRGHCDKSPSDDATVSRRVYHLHHDMQQMVVRADDDLTDTTVTDVSGGKNTTVTVS